VNTAKETVGEHFDDAVLTAKVKAALIESPDTKAHQITVETSNGVVQLGGFVNNEQARAAATTVAMSVAGVKSVSNEIAIKSY
jgi:osmotically-inducible protein OsmY